MTAPTDETHRGRCLCGALTFTAEGAPLAVSYCHCRDCRRATGAPVSVFAGFTEARVRMQGAEPRIRESSPGVRRAFCGTCGTPLFYADHRLPGELFLTVGVFDHPERLAPARHAWVSQQLPWLRLADDLPRHAQYSRPRPPGGAASSE